MNPFVYSGNIIFANQVVFDPISQMFKLVCSEYSYWDNWRRDSGRYTARSRQIIIFISTSTPHIKALMDTGCNGEDVAKNIFGIAQNYLDYAINGINKNWITYTATNDVILFDRLDEEAVANNVAIHGFRIGDIVIHPAY